MKDDIIKEILSNDLKNIASKDFNRNIIQQLSQTKKKEVQLIFNQKSIVISLWIILSLFTGLKLFLFESTFLINALVSTIPLALITFNIIHMYTINQNQNS